MDDDERVPPIPKELKIKVKPEYHLALAHEALRKGDGGMAIQQYIGYITNLEHPEEEMGLNEQSNLSKLILSLNDAYADAVGEIQEQVLKCYLQVVNYFPDNAIVANAFGVFLFSQGEYNISRKFLQSSAAAGYLPGEKNFLHLIWHLIPRWHFRMLNDKNRNESYRNAITKAVNAGLKNVFDIGTGAGLLTLLAVGASKDVKVVAFEENKVLSELSQEIFKINGVSDRVKLINENSSKTKDPEACDLIVTEIFDAGVFGEDCLDTLIHALENFCKEKTVKIIPQGVKVYVTGFESVEIAKKFRVLREFPEISLSHKCIVDVEKEPYDSDFLKTRKDLRFLTNTCEFLTVSFYDLRLLTQLNSLGNCIPEIELVCTTKGTIHSLAVWFDLSLDEEIVISTNPSNENNKCWEQAVFHLDHPVEVDVGDTLKLKPWIVEGRIRFQVLSPKNTCKSCIRVTRDVIAFLNDRDLVTSIIKASECYTNCENLKVVDFNTVPLFGFLMAKKGATVFNVYKDENNLNFFTLLVGLNKLHHHKVVFIHDKTVEQYMVFVDTPDIVFRNVIHSELWTKDFTFKKGVVNFELLPRKIRVHVQLVKSDYLDFCNKVDDENTFGLKISQVMNEYTGSEHPNFDNLDPESFCSNIVKFDITDLDKIDFHCEGVATKDATCNGILYWFEIQIANEESTYNAAKSIYYENTCVILKTPKTVKENDIIMFHVMRFEGHLKVYCD